MKKVFVAIVAIGLAASAETLVAAVDSEAEAEIAARVSEEDAAVSLITKNAPAETKAWYRPDFTWGDVNVNYLDWSAGSIERSGHAHRDFPYVELEGGAGWRWGELYFFTDLENPGKGFDADKAPSDSRWTIKPILDLNIPGLGDRWGNLQLHVQDYYLYGKTFFVNNFVAGLSYKYVSDDFFMRPFVGVHYAHDKYTPGQWNGYMGGWVFNYAFRIRGEKFALSDWHEFEWDRADDFGKNGADGASWGFNGALAAWWHVNRHVTGGIQYRYSYHKLGVYGYLDGLIYTLKYNF